MSDMNMKKSEFRILGLRAATWALLAASILANILGGMIAEYFRMPIWLDCVGTFAAGVIAGPLPGALSGVLSNFAKGILFSPSEIIYSITSGLVGFLVGLFSQKRFLDRAEKIIICGLLLGSVAAVISTPINMVLWGGQSGNLYNDFLFSMNVALGVPVWLASLANGLVVDISDKMVSLLLALLAYKLLPGRILCHLAPWRETGEHLKSA